MAVWLIIFPIVGLEIAIVLAGTKLGPLSIDIQGNEVEREGEDDENQSPAFTGECNRRINKIPVDIHKVSAVR